MTPTDYWYKICKQTNKNMYINKQTTANAEFNPNSIKIFLMWKWHLKISATIQYQILLTLKCAWHSQWGGVICSSFRDKMIIDIKYVNKQTNNMYINKQTTVKAVRLLSDNY